MLVRVASAATPEMILELFPDALRWEEELSWNAEAGRVDAFERHALPRPRPRGVAQAGAGPGAGRRAARRGGAGPRGARAFAEEGEIDRLLARVAFAARAAPESGIAPLAEEDVAAALREACAGRRSFAELREAGLAQALLRPAPRRRRARPSSGSRRSGSRSGADAA